MTISEMLDHLKALYIQEEHTKQNLESIRANIENIRQLLINSTKF